MADSPNFNIKNVPGSGPIIRHDGGAAGAGGVDRDFIKFHVDASEKFSVDKDGLPTPALALGDARRTLVICVGDTIKDQGGLELGLCRFDATALIKNIWYCIDTAIVAAGANSVTILVSTSEAGAEVATIETPTDLAAATWTAITVNEANDDMATNEYLYLTVSKTGGIGIELSNLTIQIEYETQA